VFSMALRVMILASRAGPAVVAAQRAVVSAQQIAASACASALSWLDASDHSLPPVAMESVAVPSTSEDGAVALDVMELWGREGALLAVPKRKVRVPPWCAWRLACLSLSVRRSRILASGCGSLS
jgi:hypothetical protein